MLSSDKSNMSVSVEVNLSSSKVGLSSSKVILSSGKVGLSSMKVILSKILILKSIVCCVCVMFSSDVSWGSMEKNDEINDNDIVLKEIKLDQLQDENLTYKVVLLGNSQVGKTQIFKRKQAGPFDTEFQATIGVDFTSLNVQIKQGKPDQNIKLRVWDTAGQETYKAIILNYVKQTHAFVLVYDITNKESFENIQTWIKLAEDNAGKEAVYFLVGNKADLEDQRKVSKEEAQEFAEKNNMRLIEVSAFNGQNINELFEAIANACFNNDTIKKIKNEYTEDPENKYTKNLTLKDPQDLHELENNKKNNQIPPPSKNKRCSCCPCCNKNEEE